MDLYRDELRDRLLAQHAPDAERLAEYRKGVEAMLEQVHRQTWWVGCAYAVLVVLGTAALSFGTLLLGIATLYLASRRGAGLGDVWVPALGSALCLFGAVVLVRHLRQRKRTGDLLLELKRLELRILELETTQRLRSEK